MQRNESADQTRVEQEARAWALRQKGWTQAKIAQDLGINQGNVSRLLDRVERRELKRLSKRVENHKARQTAILEHVVCEALEAWERSKQPRKRAGTRTASGGPTVLDKHGKPVAVGGQIQTVDVQEREGEPAYLDRALIALRDLRRLWGLDVAERPNEASEVLTVSALAARLKLNAAKHDEIRALPAPNAEPADGPSGD